ncbi:MAG: hydrogenase expression/formation protein HypE [Nitrospinaceae bacterium]|nr:MAG: hydrogenase expression/formation protein HypE [Nitrospinaceae bacterium]
MPPKVNHGAGACPLPHTGTETVLLGHGSGGRLSEELLREVFLPAFKNPYLEKLNDQAIVPAAGESLAFTTDSFVVDPLFFPGGDIGSLAIHGTVNDLAVGGARPLYLSAAFILEEGLPMAHLKTIVASMQAACLASGVALVTGDTKVVDRGKGDGVFITTSGVGALKKNRAISVERARPGDKILLSGSIGDHGIAILSVREGIEFETRLTSDSAPLVSPIGRVLAVSDHVHCLRDPTRGGVSSTLNEIARASGVGIEIDEGRIPIHPEVRGACELLGLDPLYVANEGKFIAVVAAEDADRALEALMGDPLGRSAALIGEVVEDNPGRVVLRSRIGGRRVVQMLAGEQLPRIC